MSTRYVNREKEKGEGGEGGDDFVYLKCLWRGDFVERSDCGEEILWREAIVERRFCGEK